MNEFIDLAFDHILLAPVSNPVSNRKRNRENGDDDEAANNVSSKRSSSSNIDSSSRKQNEDAMICTVIETSKGRTKCIHDKNKSYCKECGGGGIC